MVSINSLICMFITAFISLILPFVLWIYFYKKYKISGKAVLVGTLIFIVFQLLTRVPMLNVLKQTNWFIYNQAVNPWLISILLGLTAGLFEEIGRFIGFKYLLKNKLRWPNGVGYGIGHGGIEAILIVGLAYINNIVYSFLLNHGQLSALNLPQATLQAITNSIVNTPSYMFLIAGWERLFTLTLHIALSLIVLYAVKHKQNIYLLIAFLLHTAIDTSIGFIHNIFVMEAFIAIFSVGTLIFIAYKIKKELIINEN